MMSIDREINVTAMQFLLVQNRHQTHDWTLIRSGANGLDIQVCECNINIHNVMFDALGHIEWEACFPSYPFFKS